MNDQVRKGRLVLQREIGESFMLGDDIEIKIDGVRYGKYVTVSIVAPKNLHIRRSELLPKPNKD